MAERGGSRRVDWNVAVAASALLVSLLGSALSFTGGAAAEAKRNDEQDRRIDRIEGDQRRAGEAAMEINTRVARMEGKLDLITGRLDEGRSERTALTKSSPAWSRAKGNRGRFPGGQALAA